MGALDKQAPAAAAAGLDPAAVRKVERADRRTQLFAVVREAMAQCGFPAEGYRFKVVALDAEGWRYLVLVDLAPALEASEADPGPVQGLVAVAAKMRADIVVEGVYWRPAAAEPGVAAPPAAD
jgi:hypothetical protein